MDDRALRSITAGLGGAKNGEPRDTGFDITAASEVMALLSVARDLPDLRRRLGAITVAHTHDGEPVTADDLDAAGAMTVLLKDALKPNLVQTLEGRPAFVHCGPFANIALGTNSLLADTLALQLADIVVTESGFGADMGFEKFVDIACRVGNLEPAAVVLVATVKALRYHGEGSLDAGAANLTRHVELVRRLGWEPVVAVNAYPDDTLADLHHVRELALDAGARAAEIADGFRLGGEGALALAGAVLRAATRPRQAARAVSTRRHDRGEAHEDRAALLRRSRHRALGAGGARHRRTDGRGTGRTCRSAWPRLRCRSRTTRRCETPRPGSRLPIRALRAYTGAGWLTAFCGDVLTMPGLPADAAATHIDIDDDGRTVGLW